MENAREARRRRIVERGTDRIAFITGQVRSIPKQEDPPSPVASVPEDDATRPVSPTHQASDQIASSTVGNDDRKELLKHETSSELPKYEMHDEIPKREKSNDDQIASSTVGNDDRKELLLKHEVSRELAKYETRDEIPKREKSNELLKYEMNDGRKAEVSTGFVAYRSSDQVGNTAPCTAPRTSHRIFTFSQISSSISASENIRLLCSVVIALLVVLSYHGYLLGGKVVGSIINFRPLFLVLLTDATIIFGQLLVIQGSEHKGQEVAGRTSQEERGLVDDIGKALEVVMVLRKALAAAFMDCSICAVIIISGIVV